MNINTRLLRQYLRDNFSVEEFSSFLFDYFPQVYSEITPEMRQSVRIQLLLEYCRNNGRFPFLFADLEREHPDRFQLQEFSQIPLPASILQPSKTEMPQRNPHQILISYAHQDAAIAKKLSADLQAQG